MKVTQDDLLDALKKALERPEAGEGATVIELMEQTGKSNEAIRKGLGKLAKAGRLETTRVHRANLAGIMSQIPAYIIRKAAKVK